MSSEFSLRVQPSSLFSSASRAEQDVRVFRFRREVVSLFSVSDKIEGLESDLEKARADTTASIDTVTSTIQLLEQSVDESIDKADASVTAKLTETLSTTVANAAAAKEAADIAAEKQSTQVANAIADVEAKLENSISTLTANTPKPFVIGWKQCMWNPYNDGYILYRLKSLTYRISRGFQRCLKRPGVCCLDLPRGQSCAS